MDVKQPGENLAPPHTSIAREPSPPSHCPRRARYDPLLESLTSKFTLTLGCLLASASTLVAIQNAVHRSMDFQWSAAHLLLLHRDPWSAYLSGDAHHEILLSQIPNYLHELYVLLLPLGFLPFSEARFLWALCNLLLIFVLSWKVARLCELKQRKTLLLFVLVCMSTPFRVTVGNGQSDAVALAAIALWAGVTSQNGRGLLLGIAYEKYSFPPVLAIFLLLRRRWKLLIFSLIPPLLGFLLVDAWLTTGGRTLAIEPFLTAVHKGSVTAGLANLVAIMQMLLKYIPHAPPWTRLLPYGMAILLACGIAAYFSNNTPRIDGRVILACLVVASLACFQHQIYDFLALIFPLGVGLKSAPSQPRTVVFTTIAYFWYLERLLGLSRWETHWFVIVPSFLILLGAIAATCQLRNIDWSARWEI